MKHEFKYVDSNGAAFGVGSVLKVGKKTWDVVYRYDLLQVMLKRRDESTYKYLCDSEHQHWEVITPEFLEVDFTKGTVLLHSRLSIPTAFGEVETVRVCKAHFGLSLASPTWSNRYELWEDMCRNSYRDLCWFYNHTNKEKVFPLR